MDCYELLVEGLEGLGVQYAGKGGLYEYLVTQAREQGLPGNHFLNGEGVVSASGTDLFRDVFYPSKDPEAQAEQVMARIGNMLETGQILSFSMKNRGHTGIISERAGK